MVGDHIGIHSIALFAFCSSSYYFCIVFPVYFIPVGTSMDRFMATKPGENIPKLGNEVVEDPDIAKKRKKGMQIEWNTEDVYTMALWSAYFDWIDWQILNFPGIRPFSATSVAGVQPIKLTLYSVSDSGNSDVSSENITSHEKLLAMEISNPSKSCLGNEAKKWKTKSLVNERVMDFVEEGASKEETTDVVESDDASPIICDDSINEEVDDEIDDNSDDEEEPMYYDVAEIEESLDNFDGSNYLLSGIPILLREGTGNFVASGGGYAVLQSSQSSSIVLEKTFGSKKTFSINHKSGLPSLPSMIIRSGDIVRVKLIQQADRNTAKIVKYLSIHRGWWLKWTSTRPKRNGSFYIRTNGSNGEFMPLGHPFSLASRRWSHYLVGACVESSIKFGGRMLGIYKNGRSSMADEPDSGEDDYGPMIENEPDGAEKSNNNRMMPLLLCAEAIHSSEVNFDSSPPKSPTRRSRPMGEHLLSEDVTSSAPGDTVVELLEKRYALDAPAWIEMMNRTKRTKQLVYVIRVEETMLKQNSEATQSEPRDVTQTDNSFSHESHPGNAEANNTKHHDNSFFSNTYVKLRTGHDLAPVLRLGLECNKERSHTDRMLQISDMDEDEEEGRSEQR